MDEVDDSDVLLCLTAVLMRHEKDVCKAREEAHRLLAPFHQLLGRFANFYSLRPPSARGRPPKLRYLHQVLGLLLCFYVGSMEHSTLCMVFGLPLATLSRTMSKAEVALYRALQGYAPARISFPSPAQQANLAKLVESREPLLQHTFGLFKNLRVMQPSNADLQNAMYNGWLHSVFVTGTICFAVDGRILTPLKDGDIDRLVPSLRSFARTLHNAITSVHQAAEWGMGSMQKVYSRLNIPLPYDPGRCGRRLNNIFRMTNFRIRTTFNGDMGFAATVWASSAFTFNSVGTVTLSAYVVRSQV
uniref:DDE Tnp4 domain-containing protein n=1 Tax=Phytophthora ramorum TaxID=164328 RepID=H3GRG7_PHYRM